MPLSRMKFAVCMGSLALAPLFAGAEDIDLFQGGGALTGNRPNILFILDNSANWSRNDQDWPGGKQGEAELRALAQVIGQHQGDLRMGLMMFTQGQQVNGGGYVRFGVRDIAVDGNAAKLKTMLEGILPRFDNPAEKVGSANANYSNVMYEAYRYFGGQNMYASPIDDKRDYAGNGAFNLSPFTAGNIAGNALASSGATQYQSPLTTDAPCSKNYIIFIGNGFPSRDADPSSYGDARVAELFNKNQIYASNKVNYADEWARFLRDHGVEGACTGSGEDRICADGTITTYTIDVYNAKQDMDQTRLLKSMAAVGGGQYFAAKSETDIINAISTILNDVQAVDSVFTSASLPVSVNTQGTYLNQIYMGVFRPDDGGRPRWMGNLKQYRFGLTTDAKSRDQIYLADSTQDEQGNPNPAVNLVTGFIKPDATSYWSSKNTTNPFWSFHPKGVGEQYDAPDGDLVEKGGAAQRLRELRSNPTEVPAARKMFTCTQLDGCTSGLENFNTSNSTLLTRLGTYGGNASLIEWVRGRDNKNDENLNNVLNDTRASIHGDVLHSRPVVINYGASKGLVAFYGSNDGTLRAVRAGNAPTDGSELWSFVSSEHYASLGRLYNNYPLIKFPNTPDGISPTPTKRNYYFDGNIGVYQSSDLSKTHIFASMRRGGRAIYAFDVSDPVNPSYLWKRSHRNSGFSELGLTFSEPKVAAIKREGVPACDLRNASTYQLVLIFGAGYDANEEDKQPGQVRTPQMGRGVFVLDAANGNLVKFLQPANSGKKYSFAADVTLLDTDSDACIDRIYAADTGGNVHRYDLPNTDTNAWQAYHVAQLGDIEDDGGNNDRKFLYPVDAVIGYEGNGQVVYLMGGTGDRETPHDTTVLNHFFMIKDTIPVSHAGDLPAAYPRRLAHLEQVTVFDSRSEQVLDPYAAEFKGWYLPLSASGEKAVNAPLTVAGVTYFGTNIPKPPNNQCAPNLGEARGYALNFLNGTAAAGDRNQDGSVNERDLYAEFIGGGLPPSPVTGVVKIEEKYVRFVIGSGGTGGRASAIEGHQVQANPNSNRTRVYWYFKKD